jgi:hypothetical protein
MLEEIKNNNCKKCNEPIAGQFCSSCGHPIELKRISGSFVLSEISSLINFEKGFLFTIRELLLRPETNIRIFIHEDRNRLVKPISFIILCSLIYILTQQSLQFDDGYMNFSSPEGDNSSTNLIMDWVSKNYGLANIIMANFIALWAKVFFRRYDYNIFETLILLYFVIGIQMLLFSVFGAIDSFINFRLLDNGGAALIIAYVCWAIGRFFDSKRRINYVMAVLSYFLGMISFIFAAILLGSLIDIILM